MPVYNPLVPTGAVNLDVDYQNLQGNFEQANIVYGTDHYPFDNATPNQGFHNLVTTPPIVNNPPDGLPPATAANPKLYAYQQYPALGVLHYSRGPNNAVPTPVSYLTSASTPIVLGIGATTNVLDFTGFQRAMCIIYAMNDVAGANKSVTEQLVVWSQNSFSSLGGAAALRPIAAGNILQLRNDSGGI